MITSADVVMKAKLFFLQVNPRHILKTALRAIGHPLCDLLRWIGNLNLGGKLQKWLHVMLGRSSSVHCLILKAKNSR